MIVRVERQDYPHKCSSCVDLVQNRGRGAPERHVLARRLARGSGDFTIRQRDVRDAVQGERGHLRQSPFCQHFNLQVWRICRVGTRPKVDGICRSRFAYASKTRRKSRGSRQADLAAFHSVYNGLFKVRGEGERRVAGVERPVVLL